MPSTPGRPDVAVLAVFLPVEAQSVWAGSPEVMQALGDPVPPLGRSAGVDVAIVSSAREVRNAPDSRHVIALVDGTRGGDRPPSVRVVAALARIVGHLRMRWELAIVRGALRRSRREPMDVLRWDYGPASTHKSTSAGLPIHDAARYPRRAMVSCGSGGQSVLDRAAREAAVAVGNPGGGVHVRLISFTKHSLIARTADGVLRLAFKTDAALVTRPAETMRRLHAITPLPRSLEAVPSVRASGSVKRVTWSLEEAKRGMTPEAPLADELLVQCTDFLVGLRSLPSRALEPGPPLSVIADELAGLSANPDRLQLLAARAEGHLSPLRAGIAHGDFWSDNLLVEKGRLLGVVDWDSATGDAMPFVDLLHLFASAAKPPGFATWGTGFVAEVLPLCASGGNSLIRSFGERIQVDATPRMLTAAATGCWLSHVGYQVRRDEQTSQDRGWLHRNVDSVAAALAAVSDCL